MIWRVTYLGSEGDYDSPNAADVVVAPTAKEACKAWNDLPSTRWRTFGEYPHERYLVEAVIDTGGTPANLDEPPVNYVG